MIKIVVEGYLLKSHKNGFDVCPVKKDCEPIVYTRKDAKDNKIDCFDNFDGGTYHANLQQALQKIKTLMVTSENIETFEELSMRLDYVETVISNIGKTMGVVVIWDENE